MESTNRPHPETTLVTGASGFLGRALVDDLIAQGHQVRVVCRGPTDPFRGPVESVVGDLRNPEVQRDAVRGVRSVYHLAAVTRKWLPDPSEFRAVNVEAATALARHAAEAGVKRFVHVSSFTVFGPSRRDRALDEDAPLVPQRLQNDYQRTKCEAHLAMRELATRGEAPVVVACPGVLYGAAHPRFPNPIAECVHKLVAGRTLVFPGGGHRVWTFSFVPDVVAGLQQMRWRTVDGTELILGGDVRPVRDVFDWVHRHASHPGDIVTPPLTPFLLAGAGVQLAARLTGRAPRFTHASLRFLRRDWNFSSDRARETIDYRITPIDDALASIWKYLHDRQLVLQKAPTPAVPAA